MEDNHPQFNESNDAGAGSSSYSNRREKSSSEIDLGLGSSLTSRSHAQAQAEVDIVSLHDSSQEMATETLPAIVAETPDIEIGTPSSVMHRPSQAVDIAQQILNPRGRTTESTPSRQDSPEAAPISPEDVEEVAGADDEDDALGDIESLLNYTRNKMVAASQPVSASQPAPKTKGKRTYGSAASAARAVSSTQPDPTRNAASRVVSATQPEPTRSTRAATRHADAVTNTITISSSSSEDEDDEQGLSSVPPSTAPPPATSFTPINKPTLKAPPASQPVRRRHTANTVDLTQARPSSLDVGSDDDASSSAIPAWMASQSAAFRNRLKNRRSSERTKSQV